MTDNEKLNNALNESSLAMQFTMFHLAHSPLYPILSKMSKFDSFGAYIAECADSSSREFFPDLMIDEKNEISELVNS